MKSVAARLPGGACLAWTDWTLWTEWTAQLLSINLEGLAPL